MHNIFGHLRIFRRLRTAICGAVLTCLIGTLPVFASEEPATTGHPNNDVSNIGSLQVRNVGTIGGNLINAVPSADGAIPLIALDGKALLNGPEGERSVEVIDLFIKPYETILKPGDRLYLSDRASADIWDGQNKQVIQWLAGKLSNEGEAIQFEDSHGIVVDYLKYSINSDWPAEGFTADGLFQVIHPGLDNHFPENWTVGSMEQTVNISKLESRNTLSIYPNPTRDMITINALDYKNQSVEIYNLTGQMIGNAVLNGEGEAVVDLSLYNSGILLIKVGEQIKKVVVVK